MKYLRDLIKITIFVTILYIPLLWWSVDSAVDRRAEKSEADLAERLVKTKNNFEALITAQRFTETCLRLASDYDSRYIESYRFIAPDIECFQPNNFTQFPPIQANSGPKTLQAEGRNQVFIRFKQDRTEWSYSVLSPARLTFFDLLKTDKFVREGFFQELLLVVYIIFAFIFFSVLVVVDSIKNKFRKNGKDPLWLKMFEKTFGYLQLGDMQILKQASSRLADLKNTLELERDVLQRSLEHTILNEIRSNNHNVPFTFFGTVAKVDINGFSKIVAQGGSSTSFEMSTLLENLGCELLQRYNGLFEKTVGDEIVVVFRGEDSQLKAVAFVRDLMKIFSELSFKMGTGEDVRKFTLKGSIASSKITFCKRTAGYGFLGDAFTIASRLLEAVADKTINILSVLDSESSKIARLALIPDEAVTFKFKNMSEERGYFVSHFKELKDFPANEIESYSKYFLSDKDLEKQISALAIEPNALIREKILNNFAGIEIRMASDSLVDGLISVLKSVIEKPSSPEWNRTLSRLVSTVINFIPNHQWREDYSRVLLSIPLNREGRVNSAILSVLMVKDSQKLSLINTNDFIIPKDPSNRTRGQILLGLSRLSMSDQVISQICTMIKSKNENESATGLFVACEVINYFWKNDIASLATLDKSNSLNELLIKKHDSSKSYVSARLGQYLDETIALISSEAESEKMTKKENVA